ncbi:MAG: ABC-F family ATP-binding cassette domain-containing protein [Oscillospiraceae bacterium]|jgi:ATP-binding cassette subfamily F protein 3|nr:ABC-F family ATP-binding cassette domain-containing protein [Oscillospiraceae bacterium]
MIISLENISKFYNGNQVLKNAALTIEDSDRIGLVGINGCGKSTLLRIIAGLEIPDKQPEPHNARISKNKGVVIGFLAQNSGLEGANTINAEMRSVFGKLLEIAQRLEELRNDNIPEKFAEEYSLKTAFFEANDGYLIDVKINKVLNGMGFLPETRERAINTLSGGEKTRLALAKLLLENPGLLILDEPTNHLDFDTILWLEDYLRDYKGALLIVSHDRYFLDRLITSTCEIERGTLRRFKGNYTAFTAQKADLVTRQLKEYEAQLEEIAKLKDYIDRNLVRASTSNMAKSRRKQLEAMEIIEKPMMYEKSAKIKFAYDRAPVKELLIVEDLKLAAGENNTLVESLSFNLRRGEKLAVVGANGSGKSTLLKVIQNMLPYSRGFIRWGDYVKIAYFEQANDYFKMNDTCMNAVHRLYPRMTELEVRNLLGLVRITGENVYKKVGVISGGERAKLRFAIMMPERGNVLILDEPTNHLDIDTREVLEAALSEFGGTIIFVSHDRYLLHKLGSRVLEIADHCIKMHDGFESYVTSRRERQNIELSVGAEVSARPSNPGTYRTKEQRALETKKRVRISELESEIHRAEILISDLQSALEDPEVCADYQLLSEKAALFEQEKKRLSELSDEWLELSET